MDDEQRKYFADMMATMNGVAADARASAAASYEALQVARRVESRVAVAEGSIQVLQKHVFGSEPPPPPTRPIAESVGDHESEIATLAGQVIAARAEVAEVKKQNEEQLELTRTVVRALGNPMLRRVAWVMGSLILTYAAAKGLVLK